MADVQTTDINTKPTVTAIDSNDQIYISDGGTALKKISYTNLAKAIIEQYNASQLAGATKTIQTAINELNSNIRHSFSNTTSLTSQLDALASGTYTGLIGSYNHKDEVGMPANDNFFLQIYTNGSGYIDVIAYQVNNTDVYRKIKKGGTWNSDWEKQPTRAEVDSLNSKNYTDQANGISLLDFVATLAKGTYNFRLDNAPEAPVTGGVIYTIEKTHPVNDTRCSIIATAMNSSDPDIYSAFVGQNATSITWKKAAKQSDVDALSSKKWKHLEMGDHSTLTLSFSSNYVSVFIYGTGSGPNPFMATITASPNDVGIIQYPSNRGITISGNKDSVVITFPSSWYNMWVSAEYGFTYSIT